MTRPRPTLSRLAFLAIAPTWLACEPRGDISEINEQHCANQAGNATCVDRYEGARNYCVWGGPDGGCFISVPDRDGCVAAPPDDPECYSPCGQQRLSDDLDQTCDYLDPPTGTSSTSSTDTTTTTSSTTSMATSTDAMSTTSDASSESGTSEDDTSTTGPAGCVSSDECMSPDAPHCDELGECVSCSEAVDPDAACVAMDPSVPVCFEGSCVACTDGNAGACEGDTPACLDGECVECTPDDTTVCDDALPVCGETNTCVPCNEDDLGTCDGETPLCIEETCQPCVAHDECPAGEPRADGAACDLLTGACFPQTAVWHVDGDDGCTDEPNGGTAEIPLCTVGEALARASAEGSGTIILHELEGDLSYVAVAGFTVSSNVRVAILAAEGEVPRLQGSGGNPGLRVEEGATAYLRGLSISQGIGNGVEVLGTVLAENLTVAGNTGVGVSVTGSGRFEASRCSITSNTAGGVRLGEAQDDSGNTGGSSSSAGTASSGGLVEAQQATGTPRVLLENCMVAQGALAGTDAVAIYGGSATILYSSLAASFGGQASALRCNDGGDVSARNSLFVSLSSAPEVVCTSLSATYSAAELNLGDSNTVLPEFEEDSDWFVNFALGDLHLDNPLPPGLSALLTTARWRTGDPRTDFDGDARPSIDDTFDVAGADRPAPYDESAP